MIDPPQPEAPWFGLSPALLVPIVMALGAAVAKGIAALWKEVTGREANALLRAQNTELRSQIAVEQAEKKRLVETVDKVGRKADEYQAKYEAVVTRAAGVVYRVQQNSDVDDSVVDDMPTAVHDRAKLFAGRDPHGEWGANPNPSKPWEPTESTPPGGHPKPPPKVPRPRVPSRPK